MNRERGYVILLGLVCGILAALGVILAVNFGSDIPSEPLPPNVTTAVTPTPAGPMDGPLS